jgi:vitamin D 1,25-hydroxylase
LTQTSVVPDFPMARTSPLRPPDGYCALRDEEAPLQRARLYDDQVVWLVTRHKEARQLLTDPRLSSDRQRPGYPAFRPAEKAPRPFHTLIEMDSPEHEKYRRMLMPSFTARHAEQLRPEIQRIVDESIDELLAEAPPADLVARFAVPVPGMVISVLLGVPELDRASFLEHNQKLVVAHDEQDMRIALGEIMAFLNEVVSTLERQPGPGLLSRLLEDQVAKGEMPRDYVIVTALFLLIAGHQTASSMIALGIITLLEHPDQLAALLNDPTKVPAAVQELSRFLSPADLSCRRIAVEDIEIAGQVIRAGEGLVVPNALVNRDGDAFPDPDVFDITRSARSHIAFGFGAHQCIGQNLANMELEVVITTLFTRIPTLRVAVPIEELPMRNAIGLQGVQELPVAW